MSRGGYANDFLDLLRFLFGEDVRFDLPKKEEKENLDPKYRDMWSPFWGGEAFFPEASIFVGRLL